MEARYGLAVRYAMTLPPGNVRPPKCVSSALCAGYGVNMNCPAKSWGNVKEVLESERTFDLSTKERSGQPSLLGS